MDSEAKEKVNIKLGGMTCASCALKIENKLKSLVGVGSSTVNFANEEATVELKVGTANYFKDIESFNLNPAKLLRGL